MGLATAREGRRVQASGSVERAGAARRERHGSYEHSGVTSLEITSSEIGYAGSLLGLVGVRRAARGEPEPHSGWNAAGLLSKIQGLGSRFQCSCVMVHGSAFSGVRFTVQRILG